MKALSRALVPQSLASRSRDFYIRGGCAANQSYDDRDVFVSPRETAKHLR